MTDKRITLMTVTVKIEREHGTKCPSGRWERYRGDMVRCPRWPQCKARGQLMFQERADSRIVKPSTPETVSNEP